MTSASVNELKGVQSISQEQENESLRTGHNGANSQESYNKPITKDITLALGDDTGVSVTMKLELDSHRRERLELWRSRGQHTQYVFYHSWYPPNDNVLFWLGMYPKAFAFFSHATKSPSSPKLRLLTT